MDTPFHSLFLITTHTLTRGWHKRGINDLAAHRKITSGIDSLIKPVKQLVQNLFPDQCLTEISQRVLIPHNITQIKPSEPLSTQMVLHHDI